MTFSGNSFELLKLRTSNGEGDDFSHFIKNYLWLSFRFIHESSSMWKIIYSKTALCTKCLTMSYKICTDDLYRTVHRSNFSKSSMKPDSPVILNNEVYHLVLMNKTHIRSIQDGYFAVVAPNSIVKPWLLLEMFYYFIVNTHCNLFS